MQYKVGICDDEKGTCSELENIIINYFKNVADKVETFVWNTGDTCCNDLIKGINVDVFFLDIELPGKNGVEIGKYIRETIKDETTKIIYISSKTNYAMELFQVHPYDFLVKPIIREKVEELLKKLLVLEKKDQMHYSYTNNSRIHNVQYGDIQYLRSNNKHIEIHMIDSSVQTFRGKLRDELIKLPEQFVIIGQSDIINMKYLKECHYDYVVMRDNQVINISQRYRSDFKKKLFDYNNSGGIING